MNRQQIIDLLTTAFPPNSTVSFSPDTLEQNGQDVYKASLYWRDGVRTEVRVNLAEVDLQKPLKQVAAFSQYGAGSPPLFLNNPDHRSRFAMFREAQKLTFGRPEKLLYFTFQNTT